MLIAITLAHVRAIGVRFGGWVPLVLLDEIAAHLDEGRRTALFDELVRLGCQAWMTGTDDQLFAALMEKSNIVKVEDGKVDRP